MVSQFHYWSEDEITCNFRRMLTLEQYRNSEMADLYQKVLASGPVCFIEDLFREMIQSGILRSILPAIEHDRCCFGNRRKRKNL